ncbi:MAG: hypothetical protein AMXMBFR4_23810 [Candidatus Hydrogenedentota bacterium]
MSRIFEALEFAGVDIEEQMAPTVTVRAIPAVPKPFEEKLIALYTRIDALLDVAGGKVVSIVGLQDRAQGFTYAFEMARAAAVQLRKRVLLLGTCGSGSSEQVVHNNLTRGWESAVFGDQSVIRAIHKLGDPPISVSQLNTTRESLAPIIAAPRFMNSLRLMRKRYDLIVVDTPAHGDGMDAVLVSGAVDGTVLVVDAGHTRWQVVRHAVDQFVAQDGTVLGVVLNKRRFYIPNFIYRKL